MFALAPDQEWHLYYCVHVHPREAGRLLCLQRVHLQPVHYPQRCTSKLFCATAGAKNYWQNILSISRDAAAAEIGIAQNLLSLSHSPRWLNGLEMIHEQFKSEEKAAKESRRSGRLNSWSWALNLFGPFELWMTFAERQSCLITARGRWRLFLAGKIDHSINQSCTLCFHAICVASGKLGVISVLSTWNIYSRNFNIFTEQIVLSLHANTVPS